MSTASRVAALLVLAACGHSEPFTTADQRNDGPFASAVPLRLTPADGADMHPAWSEDGAAIVYSYRRGTADGDRCLGVLPVGGGTRLAEICALPLDGEGLLDAYTHGAMDADGRLILNRHANLPTVPSPGEGEFLLTRADSVGGRTRVVPLLQTPPGSPAPWTYLLTPAWVGPGRVVALAAEQTVGSWNPYVSTPPRPFDTTARASLIVEVLVDERPVRWNTLAQTDWVTMLAVDRAAGLLYFVRTTPRNASEVLDAARLADTVYRMPIDGGSPTAVYGAPRAPTELVGGVVGLAAGGGRLFIAELRGDDPPSLRPAGDTAMLQEILPDGTLRTIDARPIATAGHWGRIAVSPDGRQLVAELHAGTGQADLYLMPTRL